MLLPDFKNITIYFVCLVSLGKRKFCLQSSSMDEGDKSTYASEGLLSQDISHMQGVFKGTFGMKLSLSVSIAEPKRISNTYSNLNRTGHAATTYAC